MSTGETDKVTVIDARGSFCPGPLMELIAAMRFAHPGDDLEVLSTDKGSANDIPEWSRKAGHQIVGSFETDGVYHVRIRKMERGL